MEADWDQRALSPRQTSAPCGRHQSATTDRAWGGGHQGDEGPSLCLSLPPFIPPLVLQLSEGVCGGSALCPTHYRGRIERSEVGDSRVIRTCLQLRRRQRHGQKQRQGWERRYSMRDEAWEGD
ncbi:hypothetical protein CesoFtcFv8_005868 [Champsocephalus esox]|uniref:Uncharacterized protein n=1 Tax=Champsocephalus esox TaxID=159716 RepID=A0AAN8CIB9_9TELE|nr:hypothetical protein CesoFtcFv8_005868 [Champsocephalus esox]